MPDNKNRLRIDAVARTIEVEGDLEFVRQVYADYKSLLTAQGAVPPQCASAPSASAAQEEEPALRKGHSARSKRARARPDVSSGGDRVTAYSPSLEKNLDTKKLRAFYQGFAPKSHSEKIVIFAYFLEEELGIKPCNADQLFTCYRALGERVPEAYVQAIRDASKKHGYIEYVSPWDITLTLRGRNHVDHDLAKSEGGNA